MSNTSFVGDATVINIGNLIKSLFQNVLLVNKASFILPREEFKSVLEILDENYIIAIDDKVLRISLELNERGCFLTLQMGGCNGMNFLNDKIRNLRVMIEAEKMKTNLDEERIRILEDELRHCLEQKGLMVKK